MVNELWEVLVPASNWRQDISFSYEHHKQWDAFVINLTGGLTVARGAKGWWRAPDVKLYEDRIIPCRIACTREQIETIIDFTGRHYQQLAVMAYRVSDCVIIKDTSKFLTKTEPEGCGNMGCTDPECPGFSCPYREL